jgi:hypothetical protein
MRDFFNANMELLEKSIKLNLFWFRSKDLRELRNIDPVLRIEMEKYCFKKFLEINHFLKPRSLLIEGLSTYDKLKRLLPEFRFESEITKGGRHLASIAKWDDILVYAIIHSTGSRIHKEEWSVIKQRFVAELNT